MEAPKTPEEILDRARKNLKVCEMQRELNSGIKSDWRARFAYAGVKRYIPEFCEYVVQHPEFERFKDLTIADLLIAWHDVAPMKPLELEEAIKSITEQIRIFEQGINSKKTESQ